MGPNGQTGGLYQRLPDTWSCHRPALGKRAAEGRPETAALFQVAHTGLPTAPVWPLTAALLVRGLGGLGGHVDLGRLTGTHRAPREVFHGRFMEIILWSM